MDNQRTLFEQCEKAFYKSKRKFPNVKDSVKRKKYYISLLDKADTAYLRASVEPVFDNLGDA